MQEEEPIWVQLFKLGLEQLDTGHFGEAEATWRKMFALENWDDLEQWAPGWASDAWFNLGLVYKHMRRWPESLDCNLRATQLDLNSKEAWWNMGIAATALGDWSAARAAWRGFGIDVPDGEGPLELCLASVPIRLNPHGNGEVVWCRRIDPARAIIENVPLPQSGYRWRDCLLHDGEPIGERLWEDHPVPVFNVLERLEASDVPTLQAIVSGVDEGDFDELRDLFDEHGWAAEDWSRGVRRLSVEESEGQVAVYSELDDLPLSRLIGFAAPLEAAWNLLAAWASRKSKRRYENLEIC